MFEYVMYNEMRICHIEKHLDICDFLDVILLQIGFVSVGNFSTKVKTLLVPLKDF